MSLSACALRPVESGALTGGRDVCQNLIEKGNCYKNIKKKKKKTEVKGEELGTKWLFFGILQILNLKKLKEKRSTPRYKTSIHG